MGFALLHSSLPCLASLFMHTSLSYVHGRSAVDGSFFSLSVIDDDISMVIDSRDLDRYIFNIFCPKSTPLQILTVLCPFCQVP